MNAVKCYELWYTADVPEHELRGLNPRVTSANKYSMAEYLLRMVDYANQPRSAVASYVSNQAVTVSKSEDVRQPIEAIHRACKEEIESHWQRPPIDEETFADALFEDRVKDELDKLAKRYGLDKPIEIVIGGK